MGSFGGLFLFFFIISIAGVRKLETQAGVCLACVFLAGVW